VVVAFAGPRGEEQQHPAAVLARHRVPLVGLEVEELACAGVHRLATRLDPHSPADDGEKRGLLHLVLAERLPGA
jgi:hypothetical protein